MNDDRPADVVIVCAGALILANELGLRFAEGFIKNRYIGRTFIMPGQQTRKKSVRQKLNAIDLEFRKQNIVIAFPQQDIHIRSLPENLGIVPKSADERKAA